MDVLQCGWSQWSHQRSDRFHPLANPSCKSHLRCPWNFCARLLLMALGFWLLYMYSTFVILLNVHSMHIDLVCMAPCSWCHCCLCSLSLEICTCFLSLSSLFIWRAPSLGLCFELRSANSGFHELQFFVVVSFVEILLLTAIRKWGLEINGLDWINGG
jgi:hypothetical protein